MGTLEVDVELVAVVAALGHERRPRLLVEAGEHRIGGVGLALVGEVQARDDLVQQPAGEDRRGRRGAPACVVGARGPAPA